MGVASFVRLGFGLRMRATLIVLAVLAVTLAAAGAGSIYAMRSQSRMEHRRATGATVNGLALASQVAMLAGDTPEMERLTHQQLEDQQVAFVVLHDGRKVRAKAVRDEAAWLRYLGLANLDFEQSTDSAEAALTPQVNGVQIAAAPVAALEAGAEDLGILDGDGKAASQPGVGGYAVVAMSTRPLEDAIRTRTWSLAGLFAAIALGSIPPVWLVVGGLTNRLTRLAAASRRIADGDLECSVNDHGLDEVGMVSAAFEQMRMSLRARDAAMRQLTDSLQARVDEQTRDLRERQSELEAALQRAEAASRAKSDFLANMSHEIRTPMTAILGYADLLGESQQSEEERGASIATIRRSGEHLMAILNDILDLSKIEAGRFSVKRERCNVLQVVADVVSLLRPRASALGLTLSVEFPDPIPRFILSDAQRLRQILMNLVGNSIKFTERGGVTLRFAVIKGADGAPMLRAQIMDTGIGIAPEQLAKLFRPFTQADETSTRRHGGTGLGLVISRRLAELLGGDITAESAPGAGSTFTVTVATGPIEEADLVYQPSEALVSVEQAAQDAPVAVVHLTGRVLLVEDGPDNQRLIGHHLRKAGGTVTVMENGLKGMEEALRAERAGEPYDVVLMDMQMPVMDGYTAATTLRNNGYGRPIIALTAHAMSGDAEKCLAAGCDAYATKPIDRVMLLTVCSEWVERVRRGWRHKGKHAAAKAA